MKFLRSPKGQTKPSAAHSGFGTRITDVRLQNGEGRRPFCVGKGAGMSELLEQKQLSSTGIRPLVQLGQSGLLYSDWWWLPSRVSGQRSLTSSEHLLTGGARYWTWHLLLAKCMLYLWGPFAQTFLHLPALLLFFASCPSQVLSPAIWQTCLEGKWWERRKISIAGAG